MIRCPFCSFKIEIKAVPGAYQPKCPRCEKSFVLAVPKGEGKPPIVAKTLDELRSHQAETIHATKAAKHTQPKHTQRPTVSDPHAATVATSRQAETVAPGHSYNSEADTLVDRAGTPHHAHTGDGDEQLGRLDGYELVKLIGRGGMGRVYLAKQLSLDRMVAVKTIDPRWARDPEFLARFVREAYAVAQLSHHNVVQIHDIGEADQTHFFSMEFVEGQSLADLVKHHGRLDPEEAATHILHAARGLKFAHEHHMVHRDVKPSNLLVSSQGLVKVADLGLVKTPRKSGDTEFTRSRKTENTGAGESPITTAVGAIGTPAYMAPEQARDAASVDARADIYALGATFYHLVTGRPPFSGESSDAVIRQHAHAPLPPPEVIESRVPTPLSAMIQRMLAKHPDERFQNMAAVVTVLESHLGVEAGPFTPKREHSSQLEDAVTGFNKAISASVRVAIIALFNVALLVAIGFGLYTSNESVVGATIALGITTTLAYQLLSGIVSRSLLIRKSRQYVFSCGPKQWAIWIGGTLVLGVLIYILNLHWLYLGMLAAGVALAAAFHFTIDLWVHQQRKPIVEGIRGMIKDMRLCGLEEEALRRFVCRYAGKHWESFYEALFGYEAKIDARRHWGNDLDGQPRPRYRAWRDSMIEWFDLHLKDREETRQKQILQRVELQRLRAEGLDDDEAVPASYRAAGDLLQRATEYRNTGKRRIIAEVVAHRPLPEETEEDEGVPESWKLAPVAKTTRLTNWVLGGRGRFIAGALILAVWTFWARQHQLIPTFVEGKSRLETLRMYLRQDPPAVDIPAISPMILNLLCSQGAALAGITLILSAMFRGRKMTFFILPAVIVFFRAPFMSPVTAEGGLLPPYEWTLILGIILAGLGLFLGRIRYD